MSGRAGGLGLLRRLLIAAGFLLPTLTLVPFGWVWLWQQGYALWWVGALFASTLAAFAGQWWLARRLEGSGAGAASTGSSQAGIDAGPPREVAARAAIDALAESTGIEVLQSQDAMLALAVTTIETVAAHMHPGEKEPVWNFTLPEALALIETTAARLRPMIIDNVPFGDRISVGQALRVYRWRGAVDVAEKAYDLWRIVRLANPLTALTQEARERMTKKLYESVKDEVARRIVKAYVQEVGRAAIDLYSGRLRIVDGSPASAGRADRSLAAPVALTPLRLLVAGQTSAGKSSLVNALMARTAAKVDVLPATAGFTGYELQRDGVPEAVLIDSAGIGPTVSQQSALAAAALDSDLVMWVAAANRADRDVDRRTLDALRERYRARIDRLRPFKDWAPPYDIANPTTDKARSIREAMDAAASDLGVPVDDIVPVCLDATVGLTNVDLVWSRIAAAMPGAERARLVRLVSDLEAKGSWRTVLTQAANAGRIVGGAVWEAINERRS